MVELRGGEGFEFLGQAFSGDVQAALDGADRAFRIFWTFR